MKRLIEAGIKVINIKYRNSMSLKEVLEYRRSVRYFDETKELDTEKVKHCIELATLAPIVPICNYGNFITLLTLKC